MGYHPLDGGKCRVPMWSVGGPDGFCGQDAHGEQHPREILYQERGYSKPYNLAPYCFGPCCPAHGGPAKHELRFFSDGYTEQGYQMWCCVGPDFVNLQESPAGFDGNPFVARANYQRAFALAKPTDQKAGG